MVAGQLYNISTPESDQSEIWNLLFVKKKKSIWFYFKEKINSLFINRIILIM